MNPDPALIAKALALGIAARGVVEGLRVGDHKSPFRGFSAEFSQHREYVPGDDPRYIDWKGYGRSERYTVKQFEQETNFVAHVVLDTSGSMAYGEGVTNKLSCGRLIAATLAHVIIRQRDCVALALFADGWRGQWPASDQPGSLPKFAQALAAVEAKGPTSVGAALSELAGRAEKRGLVFLLTDAFDDVHRLLHGVRHLRFCGHEVTLFHLLHRDEMEFPFEGRIRFVATEGAGEVRTQARQLRSRYLRALAELREKVARGCEAVRADYVLVDTCRPLESTLTEYLARRRRVGSPR